MKEIINRRFSKGLRGLATAILASTGATASLAHAWVSQQPIVVQPAALPELARQGGQAMFLHIGDDDRALLYVEQDEGKRLAIFDVTNPARIKSAGALQLDAPGPFDFVAASGDRAEVVRFRDGGGTAVLDLAKARTALKKAQVLRLQEQIAAPIDADTAVTHVADRGAQTLQELQSGTASRPDAYSGLVDAGQVREQLTNQDTGTTFLLSEGGLYVIRRPLAEQDKERREEERRVMYSGGGG